MRLFPQLVLAFAGFTAASTVPLGFLVRNAVRKNESERFESDVQTACEAVSAEVRRQGEADHKLVVAACQKGELVDRTLTWIENGTLDSQRFSLGAVLVPNTRTAFDLDELMLVTEDGQVLGADPRELLAKPAADVEAVLRPPIPGSFVLRRDPPMALVSRCRLEQGGRAAGLIGVRYLPKLLARLGTTLQVSVAIGPPAPPSAESAQASCKLHDPGGGTIPIRVSKRKDVLQKTLDEIDRLVLLTTAVPGVAALLIAVLLARSLGRPIAELAAEARKVAAEQANPLRVRGSGEIAELVQAFDKMIEDLAATRRRLAATSRVAAWREVARRVAHEVKNPLAPIRAAVETLRRLRERKDPVFDEYFDEATRTVLDEVHRISDIVTEFTRFARLPAPKPQEVDLAELARQVVQLQKANAGAASVALATEGGSAVVRADRDQIVQIVTNLVQNALDAVRDREGGRVEVRVSGARGGLVSLTVRDNGPGIAPEMAQRLFEPYATNKPSGTGLGLAIAQRIAVEHQGELSYVGAGSDGGATFRLVLPVEGPPPVRDLPPASSS